MNGTVIITGAGGFIGSALLSTFAQANWKVIGLCRRPPFTGPASTNIEYRQYELGDTLTCDGDVLVHCAYDAAAAGATDVNLEGSARLFADARERNISKIIFISSLASKADAASRYGSEKYRIEQLLCPSRDLIVRPGLVIGKGGLFGSMIDSMYRLRIAPVFNGGTQPVYTVSIGDLCAATLRFVERECCGSYIVAAREPVTMKNLYLGLARALGVQVRLVPLPSSVTVLLLSVAEKAGLRLPIASESVRGVRNLRTLAIPSYDNFGMELKSFNTAVQELVLR